MIWLCCIKVIGNNVTGPKSCESVATVMLTVSALRQSAHHAVNQSLTDILSDLLLFDSCSWGCMVLTEATQTTLLYGWDHNVNANLPFISIFCSAVPIHTQNRMIMKWLGLLSLVS